MGFGSYDESEQEQPGDNQEDDGESVTVHENEHHGEISFESDADADELVDRLADMKED